MGRTTSSWVHGHAAVAENTGQDFLEWRWPEPRPFSDVTGFRQAFGVTFRLKPNDWHWFHVSIPTPTLLLDHRASIVKVYALFDARPGCQLKEWQVLDGKFLLDKSSVSVSGDHSARADAQNTHVYWAADGSPPLLRSPDHAVGLTLRFKATQISEVFFASFGVDFDHEV